MDLSKSDAGKKRRPWLLWLAILAISAAFICALWVNFGIRASIEANNKTVGLVVDYDELMRIADGSHDIYFADMLRKAALAGATGLVVRERLLGEWEAAGDVIVFSGGQLRFYLENNSGRFAESIAGNPDIIANNTYILTKDPLVYEQIFSMLDVKKRYPEPFSLPDYMCIAVSLHSSERASLGLGFPLARLEEAAEAGFQIIPRLRNWLPLTEESVEETFGWVAKIPNLAAVGFNDQTVPGDSTNPILQERLANAIAQLGKPLVSFEFYDQIGLPGLAQRLDNNLIRVHAIADNEIRDYADFQRAMDRYSLAATERNIRYIYVRFQNLINPAASMLESLDLITGVKDGLVEDGLIVGNPEPISPFSVGLLPMFLLGTGVVAAGGWLFALLLEPFARKKWYLPYGILVAAAYLAWAAAFLIAPGLSRKVFAFVGAVVFPCLSVILVLKHKPKIQSADTGVKRALYAVGQLLVMSVFTLIGAMIMSAILTDTTFMLRLDIFRGTKVSHIAPLVLLPLILWLREKSWYGIMSDSVKSSVKFWQLFVGLVLLAGLVVYILRTGNENLELVSGFEIQFRQTLKNILGVRPRTKEFLIGHPLMMILLYYGYRIEMFPLVMAALIGQVSIINTYAHLHTPLMVSLLRSANGLWIGILIGILAILILEAIRRRTRTLRAKAQLGIRD